MTAHRCIMVNYASRNAMNNVLLVINQKNYFMKKEKSNKSRCNCRYVHPEYVRNATLNLLSCYYCGSYPEIVDLEHSAFLFCDNKHDVIETEIYSAVDDAIEAWNIGQYNIRMLKWAMSD